MDTRVRRQQLLIYLADAEDDKVNALYTLLESEFEKDPGFTLNSAQRAILQERDMQLRDHPDEVRPWRQIHDTIRNRKKDS